MIRPMLAQWVSTGRPLLWLSELFQRHVVQRVEDTSGHAACYWVFFCVGGSVSAVSGTAADRVFSLATLRSPSRLPSRAPTGNRLPGCGKGADGCEGNLGSMVHASPQASLRQAVRQDGGPGGALICQHSAAATIRRAPSSQRRAWRGLLRKAWRPAAKNSASIFGSAGLKPPRCHVAVLARVLCRGGRGALA